MLYYGLVSQLLVMFKCDWVKNWVDRKGNHTYKHDKDGFLLANFCHLDFNVDEPCRNPNFRFMSKARACKGAHQKKKPRSHISCSRECRRV